VKALPPSEGAFQEISIFVPTAVVYTFVGASGLYATKTAVVEDGALKPTEFLARTWK
jgi:hypothetical protein